MKKLYFYLLLLPLSLWSQELASVDKINANIQRLKLEIETDPQISSLYVELADLMIKIKDYSSIVALVDDYESKFKIDAQTQRLLYLKALSLRNIGQFDQAIRMYEQYIQFDRFELEAHVGLGLTYEKIGDREKAKYHFLKYIDQEKDPQKIKAIQFTKQKLQQLESSVIASQPSILEENKDQKTSETTKISEKKTANYQLNAEQIKILGEADGLFDQGEYSKANVLYQKLIDGLTNDQISTKDPAIFSLLEKGGTCSFIDGKYEQSQKISLLLLLYQPQGLPLALSALNYAKLNQNQALVSINEMRIALKEGRFYHVLELCDLAQTQGLEPKNLIEYIKGKALFHLGKYNESLSAYEKAIQQLPHPSLVMDLVMVAMASQQFKVAQQYLENYINQEKLQNQEKPSRFFIQAQEYLSHIKGKP